MSSVKQGDRRSEDKENQVPKGWTPQQRTNTENMMQRGMNKFGGNRMEAYRQRPLPQEDPASLVREQEPGPSVFQFPPPLGVRQEQQELGSSVFQFPPPFSPPQTEVTCVVEQEGHLRLNLRAGVTLDVSPTLALRLRNTRQDSSLALSSCSTQLALVHPRGRLLQYGPRIEVQIDDNISVKNAKIHPKGVSFTANNCALVYLLDEAGARSTSDMFHDLQASDIADTLFLESSRRSGGREVAVMAGVQMLEQVKYWREAEDHWTIGGVHVRQTRDGLITVERRAGGDTLLLRTSPNNGKVRFESRLVAVTASMGEESHLFLRAGDRRLHYSGQSTVFTARNAGHSAGFDETGALRIF